MTRIVVFGAGGRAGRAVVGEAVQRGIEVTAVVRDPAKHADLASAGSRFTLAAGDVTDADTVARLAAGHDAAVNAAADLTVAAADFFPTSVRAVSDGLGRAGVRQLVGVGLASLLPDVTGTPLLDTPGYPQEYREFQLGHGAGLTELRLDRSDLDWVVLSPAGDFDHSGPRTGRYRIVPGDMSSRISYADLAIGVLDEIERPSHHRLQLGLEQG